MDKPFYIAGPMTGIPQFNYPMFDAAASILRAAGWSIQSPAEFDKPGVREKALASPNGALVDGGLNGETWGDFLARDVKLIADECAGVILLPGWNLSKGARLEAFCALLCGLPVYHYNLGNPDRAMDWSIMDEIAIQVAPQLSPEVGYEKPWGWEVAA